MAKKAKDSNLRICEICQQTRYLSEEQIIKVVGKDCIEKYAYILHDKDIYTEDDEILNPLHKAGTQKPPHWHVMIKFKKTDGRQIPHIAKWFSVEKQYVNKSKYGNFDAMLLYLIHHNKFDKFQYCPDEVKANFDYKAFLESKNLKIKLKRVLELIEEGKLTRNNYTSYVTCEDYTKYKTQIDIAFKYYDDKNQSIDRDLEVIFITGPSGSGKTTLAKNIAKDNGLTVYISDSGTDALSSYKDETAIIMDDFRPSALDFSSMLKLLDNHTSTRVASRYHNKDISRCKLILLTSVFNVDQMYKKYCAESGEPVEQLKRRCKTWIEIKEDRMDFYVYDGKIKDYVYRGSSEKVIDGIPEDALEGRSLEELKSFLKMDIQVPSDNTDDKNDPEEPGEIICPF